jgi:hypothetical protein
MQKVLILGANGQLARNTTTMFLGKTDAALTLYLRRAYRLSNPDSSRVTIVEGDVLDAAALTAVMKGQDVVYANLSGDMARTRFLPGRYHGCGRRCDNPRERNLVYAMPDDQRRDMVERIESRTGLHQLEYMKTLKMGNDQYDLISL